MTTVLCIMAAFMVLMFLLLGGVIGYLTRDFMFARGSTPQHPEFYDEGNIILTTSLPFDLKTHMVVMNGMMKTNLLELL